MRMKWSKIEIKVHFLRFLFPGKDTFNDSKKLDQTKCDSSAWEMIVEFW